MVAGIFYFSFEGNIMGSLRVKGINHLGLAAKDAVKCRWFLNEVLGLSHLGDELVSAQKTMTSMFASSHMNPVQTRLEIVSPEVGTTDGPISRYLEKKGGGIHHLAVTVENIEIAIEHMRTHGVKMIDETPRSGAHHTKIAFVHPESTGGILIELVQES
jgi:methylmalonyl-CoA/ethylmalonyl-CoA epimerase